MEISETAVKDASAIDKNFAHMKHAIDQGAFYEKTLGNPQAEIVLDLLQNSFEINDSLDEEVFYSVLREVAAKHYGDFCKLVNNKVKF